MKKGLSIIINILLFAVILFLAWQVIKSIQAPIKFGNEQKARESKVVERLIDIRNAEVLYKQANNKYTASFDTLINFCETAEIPIVNIIPDPTDTTFTLDMVGDVPSTCPGNYLIGITNTNASDEKYGGAGYGVNNIDIGAPGTSIYSTTPNNGYNDLTGTSMATPQVSGTIALMYAALPEEMMQVCKNNPANFCLIMKYHLHCSVIGQRQQEKTETVAAR